MTSLLRLLAGDATAEDLERAATAEAELGVDAAQAQELLSYALLIRTELDERRRREQELTALFETAGDLTSIRDVDKVLRAIVRRARRLLSSDAAYLMLIDPDRGDTYMRVYEGTLSPRFRQIRLAFGRGLGGLVAEAKSPYSTSNYLVDDRFAHDASVDTAVLDEALVAILGVPLMLGDRLIGVLFASHRTERHFSRQETALLCSLAAHAALALENARLFQESQESLTALETAKRLIEEHSRDVERSVAAHERLAGLILGGGGLDEVARTLAEVLDGSLLVVSPTGQTLAAQGSAVDDLDAQFAAPSDLEHAGRFSHDLLDALAKAERRGRTTRASLPGWLEPRWVTPVLAGGETLACLVLAARRHLNDVDIRTLERAAQVTALLLVQDRAAAEAEQRVRGELVDDLLERGSVDPGSLRRRCVLLGVDPDASYSVVVARVDEGDRHRQAMVAVGFAEGHGGLIGERDRDIVAVLPGLGPKEAADLTAAHLRRTLQRPVTTAGAGPVPELAAARTGYLEARRCLRLMIALGHTGRAFSADRLGVYGLLLAGAEPARIDEFITETLGALLDYDVEHDSALVATLETYLATGRGHAATASRLHIHGNTLYQRLARISEIIDLDLDDADRVLEVHVALRLWRLARRV